MAILRSSEGKFYDVPDAELANFEIPPEQVKEMLGAFGQGPGGPGGPGPGEGGAGQGGEVQPYGYCPPWRNCFRKFRNCFRNCSGFRNCHR